MITVIVLLILAAVSIQMLTGDNGIITNASKVSTSNAYYSAEEQVKLAYMAVKAEISAKTVKSGTYNPAESAETTALATIVANDLGANQTGSKWAVTSSAGTISITYTDSKIDKDSIGTVNLEKLDGTTVPTVLPREEGVVHYRIKLLPSQDAKLFTDIGNDIEATISYGSKAATSVNTGDTVSITFAAETPYTEQFMVLNRVDDTTNHKVTIMAMPYYNITLSTTDPRQSSTWDNTMKLAFSSQRYWSANENIAMSGANNVKQYINAYNSKLSRLSIATGETIEAQIGREYNTGEGADWYIGGFAGQSNTETPAKKLLNPTGTQSFWLGSSASNNATVMRGVYTLGNIDGSGFGSIIGVRPVIKITYTTP